MPPSSGSIVPASQPRLLNYSDDFLSEGDRLYEDYVNSRTFLDGLSVNWHQFETFILKNCLTIFYIGLCLATICGLCWFLRFWILKRDKHITLQVTQQISKKLQEEHTLQMVSLQQIINGLQSDLDLKRQEFDESERHHHEQLVTSDRDQELGRKEVTDLKKELETKRCENRDLSQKLQSKTDSLSQSDGKLRASNEELSRVQKALDKERDNNKILEKDLCEVQKTLEAEQDVSRAAQEQLRPKIDLLSNSDSHIKAVSEELSELKVAWAEKQEEFQGLAAEHQELLEMHSTLENEYEMKKNELQTAQFQLEEVLNLTEGQEECGQGEAAQSGSLTNDQSDGLEDDNNAHPEPQKKKTRRGKKTSRGWKGGPGVVPPTTPKDPETRTPPKLPGYLENWSKNQ